MLSDVLQDWAALYVSGALTAAERESFEVLLEFQDELRAHVNTLQETATAAAFAGLDELPVPPAALKNRLLAAAGTPRPASEPEALVVTDGAGCVQWVNGAFTDLCGYTLPELRGRKPGPLLQGAETDPAAVARIRTSLRERRPCREALVNYHKDGSPYRVDVLITPLLDDAREPLWFVARERRLPVLA